jgi:hypothetical protein
MKSKDFDNVTFKYYNGFLCENVVAHYWNVYVWLYLCWSDFFWVLLQYLWSLKYALLELYNWAMHRWVVYLIITQFKLYFFSVVNCTKFVLRLSNYCKSCILISIHPIRVVKIDRMHQIFVSCHVCIIFDELVWWLSLMCWPMLLKFF